MSGAAAFDALNQLAGLAQQHAVGLPAQVDTTLRWSGIGFSLLGCKLIAPMRQIAEMLEVPAQMTRLPGVQPWVVGLCNVRGRLLPLFDMACYLEGQLAAKHKSQRVLVIEAQGLYSGLVIDQAYGMQHFTTDLFTPTAPEVPEPLAPFIAGGYTDPSGITWPVFDISLLVKDGRFINAALN